MVGVIALPFNNYIGGLIRLFTKGKYEHLPFCDNVLASGSLRETWGKRYNRLYILFCAILFRIQDNTVIIE